MNYTKQTHTEGSDFSFILDYCSKYNILNIDN